MLLLYNKYFGKIYLERFYFECEYKISEIYFIHFFKYTFISLELKTQSFFLIFIYFIISINFIK